MKDVVVVGTGGGAEMHAERLLAIIIGRFQGSAGCLARPGNDVTRRLSRLAAVKLPRFIQRTERVLESSGAGEIITICL